MSKSNLSPSRFVQKSFNGVELSIIPNKTHEFLLTTAEVAKGYGSSSVSIRFAKSNNKSELIENQHFIRVRKSNARCGKYVETYWTKRGIIRLGFFIKSEKAKLFRDWIENLVIEKLKNILTRPQIPEYGEGTKIPVRRYSAPLLADIFISKNARMGLKTPVSRIREERGVYPNGNLSNTGAFLSTKQKSLQIPLGVSL